MAAELPEAGMVSLCVAISKAIAAELPDADTVALCAAIGKAMASAGIPAAGMVALWVAIGCVVILKPLLNFLDRAPARGHALDVAVLLVVLTVVMAHLGVVILLFTPAETAPVVLLAFRQYVLLVCGPLLLLSVPFLYLAAGGW